MRFLREHNGIKVGHTYRSKFGAEYFVKALTSDGYVHCEKRGRDTSVFIDVAAGLWQEIRGLDNASTS